MRSLRDVFGSLPLPLAAPATGGGYAMPAAHLLGGDLPQGHLHVWSGPPGAGKTAFLLGLLLDAARRGRGTCLASYDLSAGAVALRMLAMESDVPLALLDGGVLSPAETEAVARARARLAGLPLFLQESRGLTVGSLADRCVRSARRIDVLGVDYVEAVVRPTETPLSSVFRDLSTLAHQRWMAVVAVARSSPVDLGLAGRGGPADRVGWIATGTEPAQGEATVVANRHGATPSCRLRLDPDRARWLAPEGSPPPKG